MSILTDTYELNNGIQIPKVGFGTWQIPGGQDTYDAVSMALKAGYRHIDTAKAYRNEKSVGEAILDSDVDRENVFVTSKLPAATKSYDGAIADFRSTMKALNLSYLDLYLIHAHGHGVSVAQPTMTQLTWKFGKPCRTSMPVARLKQLGFPTLMSMIFKIFWIMRMSNRWSTRFVTLSVIRNHKLRSLPRITGCWSKPIHHWQLAASLKC